MTGGGKDPVQDRPLLEAARAAIPGLAEITAALPAVDALITAARGATQDELDVVDEALTAVLGGKPVPDDLGDQVLGQRRRNERAHAALQSLHRLRDQLKEAHLRAHADRVDPALAYLAGELSTLLGQARAALADLGPASSAQAAIDAGVADAWTRAQRVSGRYDELRRAQAVLLSAALTPLDLRRVSDIPTREAQTMVTTYAAVRDYGELYPPTVMGGEVTVRSSRNGMPTSETFRRPESPPGAAPPPPPWPTGDTLQDLSYLTSDQAQPWVPSMAELHAARTPAPVSEDNAAPHRSLEVSPARERALRRKTPHPSTSLPTPVGDLGNPEF